MHRLNAIILIWLIISFINPLFQNKDIFKWSDGWDMTYQNWYPNQQSSTDENQCAYLDINEFYCEDSCGYPEGYWFATSCSETHPYMCKYGDGNNCIEF